MIIFCEFVRFGLVGIKDGIKFFVCGKNEIRILIDIVVF